MTTLLVICLLVFMCAIEYLVRVRLIDNKFGLKDVELYEDGKMTAYRVIKNSKNRIKENWRDLSDGSLTAVILYSLSYGAIACLVGVVCAGGFWGFIGGVILTAVITELFGLFLDYPGARLVLLYFTD